jgi:hypothetical protein
MDSSDGEIALSECHIVNRKEMKRFCCFFFAVFIAEFRSAAVVLAPNSYVSPQNPSKFDPIYQEGIDQSTIVLRSTSTTRIFRHIML